jgi:hypothetical protein
VFISYISTEQKFAAIGFELLLLIFALFLLASRALSSDEKIR